MQPELHVDPNIYNHHFPRFDKPNVIGFIGLENLKFAKNFGNRKVKFDLNRHIHNAKTKPPDSDVKLNDLLKFLLENEKRLNFCLENDLEKAKFVCYRGLMTCIACTPYENQEPWRMVAILYKGSIYLCARDTEDKISKKLNMTEQEKRFTSWGYKFEQYMLSGKLSKMIQQIFCVILTIVSNDCSYVEGLLITPVISACINAAIPIASI